MGEVGGGSKPSCPLEGLMGVISKRWALLILAVIGNHGRMRFVEILRELRGISPKTLTERLRELEAAELIKREAFPEIPPRVEYSLTEDGWELRGLIRPLIEWVASKNAERYRVSPCLHGVERPGSG